ncbi:MAG: hypothetical protein QXL90_05415 [Candidatus Bathyarchaeia archaeon]
MKNVRIYSINASWNTLIINSSIEYSIVLENATIANIDRIEKSLIGKNAKILKNKERSILKINVGDYSEIEL